MNNRFPSKTISLFLLILFIFAAQASFSMTDERRNKLIDLTKREIGLLQLEKKKILKKIKDTGIEHQLPEFTSPEFLQVAENTTELEERLGRFEDTAKVLKSEISKLEDIWDKVNTEKIVRDIEKQVAERRGLELKNPVEFDYLTVEDLKMFLDKALDKQFPNNTFPEFEFALKQLGMIEKNVDLREVIVSLYSEQVGGLFDDNSRKLFVMKQFNLNSVVAQVILAHEICHALQDQHYTLSEWDIHQTNNDDLALASSAVLEGDAMILMVEWATENATWKALFDLPEVMNMNQQSLNSAPPALVEMLVFPYVVGMDFLSVRRLTLSATDYENIFKNVPKSTEQIFHPEKYFYNRDNPNHFTLPDFSKTFGGDWKIRYHNVLGELGVRLILLDKVSEVERINSASGWDGDRYYIYRSKAEDSYLFLWASIWDREEDAIEIADTIEKVLDEENRMVKKVDRAGEFKLEYTNPPGLLIQEGQYVLRIESNSRKMIKEHQHKILEEFLNVPHVY